MLSLVRSAGHAYLTHAESYCCLVRVFGIDRLLPRLELRSMSWSKRPAVSEVSVRLFVREEAARLHACMCGSLQVVRFKRRRTADDALSCEWGRRMARLFLVLSRFCFFVFSLVLWGVDLSLEHVPPVLCRPFSTSSFLWSASSATGKAPFPHGRPIITPVDVGELRGTFEELSRRRPRSRASAQV